MVDGGAGRERTGGDLDDHIVDHPYAGLGVLGQIGLGHLDTGALQVVTADGAPILDDLELLAFAGLALLALVAEGFEFSLVAHLAVVAVGVLAQVAADGVAHEVVTVGQ
ncbi:hypothetical protein D3C87_1793630 [compost metagenome]